MFSTDRDYGMRFINSDDDYKDNGKYIATLASGDHITNNTSNVLIRGSAGDDYIDNSECTFVTIQSGAGNDSIENDASTTIIHTGSGNDIISNGLRWWKGKSDFVKVDAGTGDDYILNYFGRYNSLSGGKGNDTIVHDSSKGKYGYGDYVTIDGGDGDDKIIVWHGHDSEVMIDAGAGNDSILIEEGSFVTVNGGLGDDTLSAWGGYLLFFNYSEGDGNDLIEECYDLTLQIGDGTGTYSSVESDSDIVVTVGDGNITLQGAAISLYADILGTFKYDNKLLKIDNNADSRLTLDSAFKNVDASKRTKAIQITGNDLDNSIIGGSKPDILDGGAGNDTLKGGYGADTFIYTGGNDVITDYGANFDKISLAGTAAKYLSHITDVSVDGNNVTLTFSKDKNKTLTLLGAAGKKVILNGATRIFDDKVIYTANKKYATLTNGFSGTFNASGYKGVNASAVTHAVTISGASSIVGGSKADFLVGTTGNDTLKGGYGADTFVYTGGKDVITDYAANFDKIRLNATGATWLSHIKKVNVDANNNVKLTFSNDPNKTLTINGAAGNKVIVNNTTLIFEDGMIYNYNKSKSTVAGGAADVYWFDDEHNLFTESRLDMITADSPPTSTVFEDFNTSNNNKLDKQEFITAFSD